MIRKITRKVKLTWTFTCGKCGRKRKVRKGQTVRCCGVTWRF